MTVTQTERTLVQLLRDHCNWHVQGYTTHTAQLILTFATKSVGNALM